jgi:Asp-tRNA(Asn)/Glu-tRNA(Gln) amidotransferase A subunit family amidase
MTEPLHALSAAQAVQAMTEGRLSCLGYAQALLERIEQREPIVRAWAHLDRASVLNQAREADRRGASASLHGLPIGWKDVIDCQGLPTACNSPIYRDHRAGGDAAAVAMSRRAGALVMGKTVTAEFAASHPGPTTHPHNPRHTPGGSSSGSAAAVADQMVPLAVGTQTGGSVIRPASFCGIVGFKPSYGLISRYGVRQLADSFDTVGTFARSVEDTALLVQALTARDDLLDITAQQPTQVTLCQGPDWDEAEACMHEALEQAARALSRLGVTVRTFGLPESFSGLTQAHHDIEYFELARALQHEYRIARDRLSDALISRIEKGLTLSAGVYESALALREQCRKDLIEQMSRTDLMLSPAAPGEAPEGLSSTGKATFNRIWTSTGLPALTLPFGVGPKNLPLGLQWSAGWHRDAALLAHARWIETQLCDAPARSSP